MSIDCAMPIFGFFFFVSFVLHFLYTFESPHSSTLVSPALREASAVEKAQVPARDSENARIEQVGLQKFHES